MAGEAIKQAITINAQIREIEMLVAAGEISREEADRRIAAIRAKTK